jgi:hypothetical protein
VKINLEFFEKKQAPKLNDEQVSTVGITDWYVLDGIKYNSDVISLDTYRKISKYYQVAAALNVISYSIQQIDWFIQASNPTVKKVLTLAVEQIWNRLIRSISKSFVYGYSANVKVFTLKKIDGKDYVVYSKIRDLDPKECDVVIDDYGNYNGFWYKKGDSLKQKKINPEYSFWYTSNMENGNLYGDSMLKTIYEPWWFSKKIHNFSNRYYERFGEPLIVGRAPSNTKIKNSKGEVKDAQDIMNDVIANIRNHASVQMPSDRDENTKEYQYVLEFLESQARGYDFNNYLDRLDKEIAIGLLLPELMYGGSKGGSYALGTSQIEVFYTNLMGIMDNIQDYVNLYILPQLIEFNFDKNKDAKFAYQPLSASSKKVITDIILKLVDKGEVSPEISQLEERSGIKLNKIEQKEVVKKDIPSEKKVSKEEVKKIANSQAKEILLSEKEKTFNKHLDEVLKIKGELISLQEDD